MGSSFTPISFDSFVLFDIAHLLCLKVKLSKMKYSKAQLIESSKTIYNTVSKSINPFFLLSMWAFILVWSFVAPT